jgi:DNA-binding beta-propeller fold protein YncE
VYVADTWNHRVQVFNSEGEFLAKVGRFGQSGGAIAAAPGQFYGPRDVAVNEAGRLYVSDTGNKRVQVFDADLNYLYAFGGPGIVEGRLDEPVGLAWGPDSLLYVADTWNRRIQAFTPQGDFVRAWPVSGWAGQSVFNKPYLAIDSAGRVYASDPEGQRVLVFDALGAPLAVLKGAESRAWPSPAGLALDAQDRLWLSDATGNGLARFSAVEGISRRRY